MTSTNRVLVTGKSGQLGQELQTLASEFADFDFLFTDRQELDLTDLPGLREFFAGHDVNYVLNCGAYTKVDLAEAEPDQAFAANCHGPGALAEICAAKGIRLIHVSTDYVFNGEQEFPLDENATPDPINTYGESKLAGEQLIRSLLDDAYIVRTAWLYSTFGKNFFNTMLKIGKESSQRSVVDDQFGSPTYARHLAQTLLAMLRSIHKQERDEPGIYHFSNSGVATWLEFANEIFKLAGADCKAIPIKTSELNLQAARPRYSALDNSKISNTFGLSAVSWQAALRECMEQLK